MEKYRSSTQLLIKTLETVDYAGREGIGITSVITKSNVCHSRLKKLMSKIVSTGLVTEIKSDGRNSFAVSLSLQVIGRVPHIIASIIGSPMPSYFDGRNKYFVELYNSFNFLLDTYPK